MVPRKFVLGLVKAFPLRDQPELAGDVDAIVSVLPDGVSVMFEPAARIMSSLRLLRLFTVCPTPIFEEVTAPSEM